MRVVESADIYFPDSVGGAGGDVNALAQQLKATGIQCVDAAPRESRAASRYAHEGIDVFRYAFPKQPTRSDIQGRAPPRHLHAFKSWLIDQQADVYHQHSWTTGCG